MRVRVKCLSSFGCRISRLSWSSQKPISSDLPLNHCLSLIFSRLWKLFTTPLTLILFETAPFSISVLLCLLFFLLPFSNCPSYLFLETFILFYSVLFHFLPHTFTPFVLPLPSLPWPFSFPSIPELHLWSDITPVWPPAIYHFPSSCVVNM